MHTAVVCGVIGISDISDIDKHSAAVIGAVFSIQNQSSEDSNQQWPRNSGSKIKFSKIVAYTIISTLGLKSCYYVFVCFLI